VANNTIGVVSVILSAKDSDLSKTFKTAGKNISKFKDDVRDAGQTIKAAIIGYASLLSARSAVDFVQQSMASVVALRHQADQLDLTTESLAGYRLAAEATGIQSEQFAASLGKMQQSITQARAGNDELIKAFDLMGLSIDDLRGKGTDEQLALIADKLKDVGSAGLRTSLAMKIFGDQGRNMLPMLADGSAGLAQAKKDADALGLSISTIDTSMVVEAQNTLSKMGEVVSAVGQRFAIELAPYITAVGDLFLNAARESNGFKAQIAATAETAVRAAVATYDGWLRLGVVWQAIRVGVTFMAKTIMDAVTWIAGAGENMGRLMVATWETVKWAGVAAWRFIKTTMADFIEWSSSAFSSYLEQVGGGLNAIKEGLGDSIVETAQKIGTATGAFAKQAAQDWKEASIAIKDSARELVEAGKQSTSIDMNNSALGEQWQTWRKNVTDNTAWELNELQAKNNERIAQVTQAEAQINDIKSQALKRATDEQEKHNQANSVRKGERDSADIEGEKKKEKATLEAQSTIAGNFAAMTEKMAETSKAAFYVNKAAQMAQAGINAWLAYSNALAAPSLSPFMAQSLAATSFAAGMVAVANIAAQQPPGRAAGGAVSRGGLYEVNERGPEVLSIGDKSFLMMGGKNGKVTPNGGSGGPGGVTVNVHNAPGTTARVERSGTDDAPNIEVIIERVEQAVAGGIRAGNGATARAMQSTYGLNRSRGGT
jgi:hypothetical protein